MSFFQNTCKPKGFAGKIMVNMMNTGHAALAEWGLTHIKIRDDDFCLDIGCGGGANLKRLLGKSSNGHITGVDYSQVSVQKSKKLNRASIQEGRCEVLQGNVMNLPFSENTFHLVTAFETIYFWPGIQVAFQQVYAKTALRSVMQEKRLSRILGIYRSNPSGSVLKVWKSYPESFYKKLVNKRFFLKIRDNPTFGITNLIPNSG